ncbi:hypothetical protein J5N97_005211 [Dioscorea zingiberensis]|uniref:Fatty acyl-CoA reductase n=1 Tax=Dioscorea zingiberensis TaxID=325984 RepID=A0A9D5D7M6_9LILI|nr:hypothetical protein J5N97_005211 [Dioscorea zingiberensis]
MESLDNKSILVTGATGFLAKLFVEKVLRTQPNVKKLYLLVRANDSISAKHRVEKEVVSKELFDVLREKYDDASFDLFFWNKVHVVQGDVTMENLGIRDATLIEVLLRDVDFIVNSAATTRFIERYDVALNTNTFGARNAILFAKKCVNLKMFLHISTAYVTKEKKGIVSEKIVESDEVSTPRMETEIELIESKMKEFKNNCTSENDTKIYMKKLGIERANKFGWPNVYSFTKAMGEFQVAKLRGTIPVVIHRPTIILSTYKEPFPGWIEGVRTIDQSIISYGKGELVCFPARLNAVVDVIPGDLVVNAMLASMISTNYSDNLNSILIYHVGSSAKNIMRFHVIPDTSHKYFSMNPYSKKDGELVAVKKPLFLPTLSLFSMYMFARYKLPLQSLSLMAVLLCSQRLKRRYGKLNQIYKSCMQMAKAYSPYSLMFGRFDDTNTEMLRRRMNNKDQELFYFDPKCINWDQFMMEIHIPGVIKYGMNAE